MLIITLQIRKYALKSLTLTWRYSSIPIRRCVYEISKEEQYFRKGQRYKYHFL